MRDNSSARPRSFPSKHSGGVRLATSSLLAVLTLLLGLSPASAQINRTLGSYVLFAMDELSFKGGNTGNTTRGNVLGGNVGVNNPDPNIGDNQSQMDVGANGYFGMSDNTQLVGGSIRLGEEADVWDVYRAAEAGSGWGATNPFTLGPTIRNSKTAIANGAPDLPIIAPANLTTLALCGPFAPVGTSDVTVTSSNTGLTLPPGEYRDVSVQNGHTLRFQAGVYTMRRFTTGQNTNIYTVPGTVLHIWGDGDPNARDFNLGDDSYFGAEPPGPPTVTCICLGDSFTNNVVNFGQDGEFWGVIYATAAHLNLGNNFTHYGRFYAKTIGSDFNVNVTAMDCTSSTCEITVDKVTVPPGAGQSFSFQILDAADAPVDTFNLTDGDPPHTSPALPPGTYKIVETAVVNWTTTAFCSGGPFGPQGAAYTPGTAFTLVAGDSLSCTFTNSQTAVSAIVVDKITVPAGSLQSFDFEILDSTGQVVVDSFSLTDGAPAHIFSPVTPGTYRIVEDAVNGWTTVAFCQGGPFGAGATYTPGTPFTIGSGETVTCVFFNTQLSLQASLTVDKVTVPAGSLQSFDFEVRTAADVLVDTFSLTDAAAPHVLSPLPPGTYKIVETPEAGWLTAAFCQGGFFGGGAVYTPGNLFTVNPGDSVSCVFTNLQLRPGGPDFCSKSAVLAVLHPASGRFEGNTGLDHLVRVDLGEQIQDALDTVGDANGDGYVLIGVIANDTGAPGGHTTQHFEITRAYPVPFGLIGCSVTVHDDDLGNGAPTARVRSSATSPLTSPNVLGATYPSIFVMDVHGADSEVAGWRVDGSRRELRNVNASGSLTGGIITGASTLWNGGVIERNQGVGIELRGDGNTLNSIRAFSNGLEGVKVLGNVNVVTKSTIGDKAKGNGASGVSLEGTGNIVRESGIYANTGSGISASGSLHQLIKNTLGDIGKGNGGAGAAVDGTGVLLQENKARANADAGLDVQGGSAAAPNRLRGNQSNPASAGSTSENAGPEYRLLGTVSNFGGANKADNTTVPKAAAPAKCPGFPATNVTATFAAPFVCE